MPPVTAEIQLISAEQRIHRALAHPAFSDWLKDSLRSALGRDPLCLANDLELLGHLLRPWAEAHMAREAYPPPSVGMHGATPQMSRA
jgi:hypothetical protein